jgi:tellurite resistance protein TerC
MYVFGAILIYTVRLAPFIVYTSNIFAILGLRAMYFLLLQTRLKVIRCMFLGFALVLLSMFFFY